MSKYKNNTKSAKSRASKAKSEQRKHRDNVFNIDGSKHYFSSGKVYNNEPSTKDKIVDAGIDIAGDVIVGVAKKAIGKGVNEVVAGVNVLCKVGSTIDGFIQTSNSHEENMAKIEYDLKKTVLQEETKLQQTEISQTAETERKREEEETKRKKNSADEKMETYRIAYDHVKQLLLNNKENNISERELVFNVMNKFDNIDFTTASSVVSCLLKEQREHARILIKEHNDHSIKDKETLDATEKYKADKETEKHAESEKTKRHAEEEKAKREEEKAKREEEKAKRERDEFVSAVGGAAVFCFVRAAVVAVAAIELPVVVAAAGGAAVGYAVYNIFKD